MTTGSDLMGDPETLVTDPGTERERWDMWLSIGDRFQKLGPTIHHTRAPAPNGPWVGILPVQPLAGEPNSAIWTREVLGHASELGDTYRTETVSVIPSGAGFLGLYAGSPGLDGWPPDHEHWRIYRAEFSSLDQMPWSRTGSVIGRELTWEQGYRSFETETGHFGEPALFRFGGLLGTGYAARSSAGWNIGIAVSLNEGRTWLKVGPPVVRAVGGMASHCDIVALPDGWFLMVYIVGAAGGRGKGLAQAMTRNPLGEWTTDPRNPVLPDAALGITGSVGHAGGPTVQVAGKRIVMHFHHKKERTSGTGPRLISRIWWAEAPIH